MLYPEQKVEDLFKIVQAQLNGQRIDTRTAADSGALGGLLQCANIDGTTVPETMCVWTNANGLLGLRMTGYDLPAATALAPRLLGQVVVHR